MTTRPVSDARSAADSVADLSGYDGLTSEASKLDGGECLYCYLLRMIGSFGCRGHRFTQRWIESQPRLHGWVIRWVERGGGYCDCEVIFNVFRDDRTSERHRQLRCAASYLVAADDADDLDDPDEPDEPDDIEAADDGEDRDD
ncbi:MAG: DUF2695 domain-containing protein [Acidothermaceae bacterium]